MDRRIAVAGAHTVFVIVLLLTWPSWWRPPEFAGETVITSTPIRWLVIATPFLWGWAAFYSGGARRRTGLVCSALLFVACLMLIWFHDYVLGYPYTSCLWNDPACAGWWKRWFR